MKKLLLFTLLLVGQLSAITEQQRQRCAEAEKFAAQGRTPTACYYLPTWKCGGLSGANIRENTLFSIDAQQKQMSACIDAGLFQEALDAEGRSQVSIDAAKKSGLITGDEADDARSQLRTLRSRLPKTN